MKLGQPSRDSRVRSALLFPRSIYLRVTQPRSSGLPNIWVLTWFPAISLIFMIFLIGNGLSGSSTSILWSMFHTGTDPNLLMGTARAIRGDEYFAQNSWVISQYHLGSPIFNSVFPGGINTLLYNDAPAWSWSMLFRPHAAGFLFLPLNQAMALRWWLPAWVVLSGAYVFTVLWLPRASLSAAMLAVATLFTPITQWWYLPSNVWPLAWALWVLSALVVSLHTTHRWIRVAFACIAGYLSVTTAMSLYVPFMIAVFVPTLFALLGYLTNFLRHGHTTFRELISRILPFVIAQIAAGAIFVIWLAQNLASVRAELETLYPGRRNTPTGSGDLDDLIDLLSGPFQGALQNGVSTPLAGNQSEAATPLLIGLFLLIPLVSLAIKEWRKQRQINYSVIALLISYAVIFAFLYVPGWSPIAKPLGLWLSTTHRVRLGFVVLNLLTIVTLTHQLHAQRNRSTWSSSVVSAGAFLGSVFFVWASLHVQDVGISKAATTWHLVTALCAISIVLFCRRHLLTGSAAFLIASLLIGLGVNPLYRGTFDLTKTTIGTKVTTIKAADPNANWVGIGSDLSMSVLFESGVHAFNGVQTYPARETWGMVDPNNKYENEWNRLAHVHWVAGAGEPTISNPSSDTIIVTFDSCSDFAQKHVQYVLSESPVQQACLQHLAAVSQGSTDMHIYRVIS